MTQKGNNHVPIVEIREQVTQTDLKVADILKIKQLIPQGFVELVEINYLCSTNPKWNKPVCERYSFCDGEDFLFLDIPHELMVELELELGKEIPYPVYLSSKVLKRKALCGAITLEKKEELFLLKPFTSEKEIQTELTKEEWEKLLTEQEQLYQNLTVLETKLSHYKLNLLTFLVKNAHKSQQIIDWKIKAILLGAKLFTKDQELTNKTTEITTLQTTLANLKTQITNLTTERNHLQTNLTTSKETTTNLQVQINTLNDQITNLNKEKNELTTQLVALTTERNNLLTRPTQAQLQEKENEITRLKREKEEWQNNYNQLLKNISNLLLPEVTTRTVATTDTLLLQQAREVIARLLSERQAKDQMTTERNNRPNITLALWNSDYSVRPTRQELVNVRQELDKVQEQLANIQSELNNPILSIIRYLLNGNKKPDFINLIELAKNHSLYQNNSEIKAALDLMNINREGRVNYNSTGNLVQVIANFLEDLNIYHAVQGYKILTWRNGRKSRTFYYDAGPTDINTGWRTKVFDYFDQMADESQLNLSTFFEDPTGMGKNVEEIYIDFQLDRSYELKPFLSEFKNFPNLKKVVWNNPYLTDTIHLPNGQTRSGSSWTWTRE